MLVTHDEPNADETRGDGVAATAGIYVPADGPPGIAIQAMSRFANPRRRTHDGWTQKENTVSPGSWLLGVLWLVAALARANIVGVTSLIVGDTLEIHGQRVRLDGADAPESGQTCLDKTGQKWRCG